MIEAAQVDFDEEKVKEIARWCGGLYVVEKDGDKVFPGINVPTLGGTKRASVSNYVVKNGKHFHVAYAPMFEETYMASELPQRPVDNMNRNTGFGVPHPKL